MFFLFCRPSTYIPCAWAGGTLHTKSSLLYIPDRQTDRQTDRQMEMLILIPSFNIYNFCIPDRQTNRRTDRQRNGDINLGAWLGIPIFGCDFWDPHCKRNSDSVFDSEDSGRIFLKFQCLESRKIGIPICNIWNSGNLFVQELTTSHRCWFVFTLKHVQWFNLNGP